MWFDFLTPALDTAIGVSSWAWNGAVGISKDIGTSVGDVWGGLNYGVDDAMINRKLREIGTRHIARGGDDFDIYRNSYRAPQSTANAMSGLVNYYLEFLGWGTGCVSPSKIAQEASEAAASRAMREWAEVTLGSEYARRAAASDAFILNFVRGTVSKEVLDQVRVIAKGHPSLMRGGVGLDAIDTATCLNKYLPEYHAIFLMFDDFTVPRGILAEELQHAIDFAAGLHNPARIRAMMKQFGDQFNDVWHKGVFNRIADAIESAETTVFDFFLDLDDALAFRAAANALPR